MVAPGIKSVGLDEKFVRDYVLFQGKNSGRKIKNKGVILFS